jgi:hypothetical protein
MAAVIFLLVPHTWPPLSFYLYHTHGRHYLFTCTTHLAAIIFLLVPHTWPPLSFYLYHTPGRHYLFTCTTHLAAIIFLLVPHTWPPLSFYLYHTLGRHYLFTCTTHMGAIIFLLARFCVGSNSTFSPWVLLEMWTGRITSEFTGSVYESKHLRTKPEFVSNIHILASLSDRLIVFWDKFKVTLLAFKKSIPMISEWGKLSITWKSNLKHFPLIWIAKFVCPSILNLVWPTPRMG